MRCGGCHAEFFLDCPSAQASEALADCLLRSFSCNPILKMLEAATSDDTASFLLRFVERLVAVWALQEVPKMPDSFQPFEAAMQNIERWCKSIIAVLSPVPRHLGSSVFLVDQVVKSPDFMDTELRDILRDSDFWKGKLKAARQVASAEAEFAGEIQTRINSLKGANNMVLSVAAAIQAIDARSEMQKQLRPGALQPLEEILANKLLSVADEVLAADAQNCTKVAIDCDWLIDALCSLPSTPGSERVAEVVIQLQQWKEANFSTLVLRELAELARSHQDREEPLQIRELQRILDQVGKSYDLLDAKSQADVDFMLAAALKVLMAKAGDFCCVNFVFCLAT